MDDALPLILIPAAPAVITACAAAPLLCAAVIGGGVLVSAMPGDTLNEYATPKEDAKQKEKRPKNCPAGTQDIDKVKDREGWSKDDLHGIKDAAHGGNAGGKDWTGVTPDGHVGINDGAGNWDDQGHWSDLK